MDVGNYVNRKTGTVVEVTEIDDKCKTVMYRGADGKEKLTSMSTFRKSYKAQNVAEEAPKSESEPVKQDTDVKDILKPEPNSESEKKAETKKQEKAKKSRVKKEKFPVWDTILKALNDNKIEYQVVGKRIKLLDDKGKTYGYYRANASIARLYIKPDADVFLKIKDKVEFTVTQGTEGKLYSQVGSIYFNDINNIVKEMK